MLTYIDPVAFRLFDMEIRWYAITMLLGAYIVYLITAYLFKKEGYDKEVASNLLLIAFPSGVVGARIWWVLSNLDQMNGIGQMLNLRGGGLAIQGGVIGGALAGILYIHFFHKEINLLKAIDIVIPNLLVAQAIGRWGNFFNQEVFGQKVDPKNLWFVPSFVIKQMTGEAGDEIARLYGVGATAQPLFYYEFLINLLGAFIISYILRKYWKKYRYNGDLAALYLLWYGTTRLLLEPLRNQEFIMYQWGIRTSILMSILFVSGGILWLAYNRVYPIIKTKLAKQG